MSNYLLLLLLSLPVFNMVAQTTTSGDILLEVNDIIATMPGASGNDYSEPSSSQLTDWKSLITDLLATNYSNAATTATSLGYTLFEFSDTTNSETYYLLKTASGGSNYWGTYILNPNACRSEIVIMAPHPKKDFNTGKQGIYCFKTLDAYFFMLSGTNRCNQTDTTTCSGSTTVCSGSSEPYRISDMAHVTTSIWQKTTELIHDNVSGTYFVQLHGFTKLVSDPYVIMSNGTRITPSPDKIVTLRDELLLTDSTLTFKIAHIDTTWNRLIGFTNTNGRYINSSSNPCTTNATTTNGRFLHIEQEKTKLRDDSTGWHKMATALGETFNSGGCPSLPVELDGFTATLTKDGVLLQWTTFSEFLNDFFEIERSPGTPSFQVIGKVEGSIQSLEPKHYSFLDHTPLPGSNYYRLKQVDIDGNFQFSKIILASFDTKDTGENVWFAGNQLSIQLPHPPPGRICLFNQLGQLIHCYRLEQSFAQIPFSGHVTGLLIYQLHNNGRFFGGRVYVGR